MFRMGQCKNCKYYEELYTGHSGYCENGKLIETEEPLEDFIDDALVATAGYGPSIYVGKNFGCIHFQKIGDEK